MLQAMLDATELRVMELASRQSGYVTRRQADRLRNDGRMPLIDE